MRTHSTVPNTVLIAWEPHRVEVKMKKKKIEYPFVVKCACGWKNNKCKTERGALLSGQNHQEKSWDELQSAHPEWFVHYNIGEEVRVPILENTKCTTIVDGHCWRVTKKAPHAVYELPAGFSIWHYDLRCNFCNHHTKINIGSQMQKMPQIARATQLLQRKPRDW